MQNQVTIEALVNGEKLTTSVVYPAPTATFPNGLAVAIEWEETNPPRARVVEEG